MFSCAVGREGHCKQISLACVGSVHSVWATLGLPLLTTCVLSRSTVLGLQVALQGNCLRQALGCVHFPGLCGSGSGEGNGTPLQYSCLENPMDGGAWQAAVYGVAKSRTRLSNFTFTFYFPALEKEMATHSSVLAWRIQGTGEPGGLPSMGSHRVGHD